MFDLKQLFVEVASNFCSFYAYSDKKIKLIASISFDELKDFQLKEKLDGFLKEKSINLNEFENVSVSWITLRASLIPMSIFRHEQLNLLFNSSFSEVSKSHELDHNRISELSLVAIYELPAWLKSFFVLRYPRVVIQHEYCHQLRGIIKNTYKLEVQVNLYRDLMSIQIAEKNELLFCNSYEIFSQEDALYYLSFSMQQLNLTEKEGKLNVHINSNSDIDFDEFVKNIAKITLFSKLEVTKNTEQIIQHQELCV